MGLLTTSEMAKERIEIVRMKSVPDGAGGFVESDEESLFVALASVKRRVGTQTAEGYKPYLKARFSFTFYKPSDLYVQAGDVVIYRYTRMAILAHPVESDDRRQFTIDVEEISE